MSWTKTGTIGVTNGSATVTGVGTAWISTASAGEGLQAPDGKLYEILSVNSDAGITLASPYLGATQSGQSYSILPTQDYIRALASQAAALVADYAAVKDGVGQGKFPAGTQSVPGFRFSADDNTGMRHVSADKMAAVAGGVDQATVDTTGFTARVLRMWNAAGTFIGSFTSVLTAARTWTFPDKDGTVAMVSDITKAAMGLSNVDNTSDANKPVSTAQQAALDFKSPLASPTFTGSPAAPTAGTGDNDTTLATTAFVQREKEYLPVIDKSLHSGAIVKAIVYDTSKDSDPAWRKRCTDKSWYTEALGFAGAWRNQLANAAAAWAVSGAASGDAYQNTTDGKYYVLSGTNSQTEIFRGNVRDFPAVAGIVVEIARVVIYDLANPGCPMWMVIKNGARGGGTGLWYSNSATSAAAGNGCLYIGLGGSNDTNGGLLTFNFITDVINRKIATYTAYAGTYPAGIGARMLDLALTPNNTQLLVNSAVNDVSVTVLDGAPVDPATGLPVPTIAVATAGGVSVIKQDGAVVNSAYTSGSSVISFSASRLYFPRSSAAWGTNSVSVSALVAGFAGTAYTETSVPPMRRTERPLAAGSTVALRNDTAVGITLLKENPDASTKGMVAYISNVYNSGWQIGDSRLAVLADSVAETITGSGELVTNGAFDTDTSGWAANGSAALAVVSNELEVTCTPAVAGWASQSIATVIGRAYTASVTTRRGTASTVTVNAGTSSGALQLGTISTTSTTNITLTVNFVATSTTSWISIVNNQSSGGTSYVDNISVKLVEPDRSVKNKGLVVNGSLTKTAVASGANLVSYSGFSAANYLEQPYNSDLDFGTGDFCLMGWVNLDNVGTQFIFNRGSLGAGAVGLFIAGLGTWQYNCSATAVNVSTAVAATTGLHFLVLARSSGVLTVSVDGVAIYSVANTENVTNAAAKCVVGVGYAYASPVQGSLALWRISATAPSADQIAHIYRTELPLFRAGAQCTIAGTSTAVTALAYDDSTDLLHVGTSWGRSGFKDLLRVDSEATTTGAITSLSANQGALLTGGTSAKYYQPAILLRDELRRKDEAKKALGKVPVFFDFDTASFNSPTTSGSAALTASSIVGTPYIGMGITGTGIPAGTTLIGINGTAYTMSANATVTNAGAVAIAQSSFTLQQGYTAKAVYSAGALKRLGATKDYLTSTDGFRETINFGTSPGSAVWISIMAIRSN